MTLRIWQQSSLDIKRLPGYAGFMREHAGSVCASDVTVDVHGIETGTLTDDEYFKYGGHWEHLKVTQIIENALRAEREGYDAVAISCFLDSGLEEAREALSIPVVSSMEVMLEVAAKCGRAVALVTRASHMTDRVGALIRQYNRQHLVVAHAPLDIPMSLLALEEAYAGSQTFVDRFKQQASGLVQGGADVIIPAEGVLNTVLIRNRVLEVDGAPVLDSYGILLAYAEMLVRMRRRDEHARRKEGVPEEIAARLRSATASLLARP